MSSNIPGLTGMEKQVYYGKAKMKAFKDMEDDPSKAEDEAMDYLKGTEGFDKSMSSATQNTGISMQDMAASGGGGFQTKNIFQASLQKKVGGHLAGVSQQISGQVTQFQQEQKDITENINETKSSLKKIGQTDKPTFKVNPMRELPFWKRIQKQYNWQTARATTNGTPALLNMGGMLGYKQSPKLSYGLGLATSFGLGQSWQNIHLSFQGIGFRSFATWAWQYGIGIYCGYERMYDGFSFIPKTTTTQTDIPQSIHSTANYNESLLIGLTKSYNISSKYAGQIQVLYDIWWKQKGMTSPIILRFATIKI